MSGERNMTRKLKPPSASPDGADGFSLLEVLVALGIMAIVLVSVYRLHSQTISMNLESRFYTQAPLLARSALAQFERAKQPELASRQGDFGREFPGYTWKIDVEDVSSIALGPEIAKDMKRIDVAVALNEGQFTYAFRTYRLVRP